MTFPVDVSNLLSGAGMTIAAHPFSYVKVLVQLGYEPLPPVLKKDMFFRKRLLYPGVFEYMGHIKSIDGFFGLYRGVVPRLCANATMSIAYGALKNTFSTEEDERALKEEESDLRSVCITLSKETAARTLAVVVSHPFHVVAIRTMASFIGGESVFASFYGTASQTYMEDGLLGFFAGLLPRLAHEVAALWLSELLAQLINTYVIHEKSELRDVRNYVPILTQYVSQGVCYPLSVTTTVMTCNGSSLLAGRPPFIPLYRSWSGCYYDLKRKGVHNRGSSMLFRRAVIPRVLDVSVDEKLLQGESPFVKESLPLADVAPAKTE